jgi:hypothetical protein
MFELFSSIARWLAGLFLMKQFRYRPEKIYTAEERVVLEKKYKPINIITSVLTLVFFLGLPLSFAFAFNALYTWFYTSVQNSETLFYPVDFYVFAIPGLLITIGILNDLLTPIQKLILGKNYAEAEAFFQYKKGMEKGVDNRKAIKSLSRVFLILSIIPLAFAFSSRILLTKTGIEIKGPTDFRAISYSYSNLDRIVCFSHYKNDTIPNILNVHYKIFFKNGDHYGTSFYFHNLESAGFFAYALEKKSKVPVTSMERDEEER